MNCIAHVASVFYGSKPKCTKDDLARRKAFLCKFYLHACSYKFN